MNNFAIIEVEDGLCIVQIYNGESGEMAAQREHGLLVDPGPYHTYESARDAMAELENNNEEQRQY